MAEKSRGVALGGALWRYFCQSIRGFEGRHIFEMGIRVRRRAEKSSSSSATVAATGMEAQRGWKGTSGRGIARVSAEPGGGCKEGRFSAGPRSTLTCR